MSSGRQDVTSFFKALGLVSKQVKKTRAPDSSEPSEEVDNDDHAYNNEAIPEIAYQYTDLPNAESFIRILELQPGRHEAPIACHLSQVSLTAAENAHSYEALSYAWGEPGEMALIRVNDGRLEIGQSLYCALQYLRYEKETRLLWVDAISIDQSSFPEREKQVPLMCEIYRNAKSTICFLGPEIGTTGSMFAMLENLAEESKSIIRNETQPASVNRLPVEREKTRLFAEYIGDVTIVDIATRAWWYRAWTVQELMLSRNAVLMIGKYTISWENLSAAVDHGLQMQLWTHIFLGFIVNPVIVPYVSMRSLMHLYLPSNIDSPGSPGADFLRLLTHCRHRDSRDPRDKIYSVLGIFRDTHPEVLTPFAAADTPIVEVGYEKDVEEVYRNISQELINKTGTLDVLGTCHKTEMVGLPSWATDWSSTKRIGSPLTQDSLGRTRTTHATRNSKAFVKFLPDGSILQLRGYQVSTIAALSEILPVPDLINVAGSKASEVYAKQFEPQLLALKQLLHPSDTAPSPLSPDFDTLVADADTKLAKARVKVIKNLYDMKIFVRWHWLALRYYALLVFYVIRLVLQVLIAQYQSFGHDGHAIMEVFYALFAWDAFARAQESKTSPLNTTTPPTEIYWHTLCCGTYHPSGMNKTREIYEHWSSLMSPFLAFLKHFRWLTQLFPWLGIAFYLRVTWEGHSAFWEYIEASKLRRLGRLENGFLGMLPRGSKVGDLVVLVGGGGVPLVVRRVDGEKERMEVMFVGEAYIHGIMDGEGWNESRCEDIEIQ